MMSQRWHNERGFTLIEAAIASVILVAALVPVLALASHSARYLQGIRRTARSIQVLQQKMEDIRLLATFDLLTNYPTTWVDTSGTYGTYTVTVSQVILTNLDYGTTPTVIEVTLTTTWLGESGKMLTNSLTTLVANGGLNKYIF